MSALRHRRRRPLAGAAVLLALLAVLVPVVLAAAPNRYPAGQRIDLRVLLLSADGTESGFGAWKAQLDREGVPYDTFVAYHGTTKAATLTDDRLADYGAHHAHYDAVILSTGDLGHAVANPGTTTSYVSALTDAEWAALERFEKTFAIRRLSDFTAPSPLHGLNAVSGGANQDGMTGTLTAAGRAVFPELKGPIPIPNDDPAVNEAFGYRGTPAPGADWQTLVAAPDATAYLGIYTHPDGREEMVSTVAGNQYQSHMQLLRHGMLNWVTRGVYLGYQRNYLELQIDDLFLADDAWDPATDRNNYSPAAASRMTGGDVAQAVAWSTSRGVRLDFAYNGGGAEAFRSEFPNQPDTLVNAFKDPTTRDAFGWINHTFQHTNLDCSTASYIRDQITANAAWGRQQLGLPLNPAEVVTGEHSGLANTRPGNPGTIDPPSIDDVTQETTGGTLPAGSYVYGITASTPKGETPASTTAVTVPAGTTNRVTIGFDAICHATAYTLYRAQGTEAAPTGWMKVASITSDPQAATDNGSEPVVRTITDTGGGSAAPPPAANGAALDPYPQNANYLGGLQAAGIRYTATDSSKSYPADPLNLASAALPAGATFLMGTVRAVPRYPSNVYYNVSKQGQQLDEYNWIYLAPPNGACVASATNTCRTAPATWDDYVKSENTIMFRHVMDNDPRPHFMHQSNLADWNPALPETHPAQGGILYPVIDGLLGRYDTSIDRTVAPLVQLTSAQAADTLARDDAWKAARASGTVSAWLQDGRLHVRNAGAKPVEVPLTGTTIGEVYAGQRSGWTTIPADAERVFSTDMAAPPTTPREPDRGSGPGGSGTRGNAGTSPTGRPVLTKGAARSRARALALTRLTMSPRRFRVAHRHRTPGTKLDGARITWRLNRSATVKLAVQRAVRTGTRARWITVGTLTRRAKTGTTTVRFTGRFRNRPLQPRRYRLAVQARSGTQRTTARHVRFRVMAP